MLNEERKPKRALACLHDTMDKGAADLLPVQLAKRAIEMAYLEGIAEANRWRDPTVDPPEERTPVLVMTYCEEEPQYNLDFVINGRFTRTPTPLKWRPIYCPLSL